MPGDRADLQPSTSNVSKTPVSVFDATPSTVVRCLIEDHQDAEGFISGVNHGPNVGADLIHSGTFCQALTANWFGLPALAISLDDVYSVDEERPGPLRFSAAAAAAVKAWRILLNDDRPLLANLNFPNSADLSGVRFASASPHEADRCYDKSLLREGVATVTVFAPKSLNRLEAESDWLAGTLNASVPLEFW